jgi:hypothetical protein
MYTYVFIPPTRFNRSRPSRINFEKVHTAEIDQSISPICMSSIADSPQIRLSSAAFDRLRQVWMIANNPSDISSIRQQYWRLCIADQLPTSTFYSEHYLIQQALASSSKLMKREATHSSATNIIRRLQIKQRKSCCYVLITSPWYTPISWQKVYRPACDGRMRLIEWTFRLQSWVNADWIYGMWQRIRELSWIAMRCSGSSGPSICIRLWLFAVALYCQSIAAWIRRGGARGR